MSRLGLAARAGVHALFAVSGALGLVYEVLWMRRFTVLFGGTAPAAAATLSGFFLGVALGSAYFGGRSRRWARPLLGFGLLEVGVALGALATPWLLGVYAPLYPTLHEHFASRPAVFVAVRLVLALAAVGLPAFCMGGTLPALAEALASPEEGLGRPVGGLYAANLLGAVAGSLSVPFLLLPRLGADGAYGAAVAGSLAVGLVAAGLGLRRPLRTVHASTAEARAASNPRKDAPAPGVLLLALFSGASTLGLQVLWTRAFSLVHESSVYAFALVVSVFLVGLAAGAALARQGLRRGMRPRSLLGIAWSAGGILVVASPFVFVRLTGGLAYVDASDWASLLARLLSLAALTVLPATLALGMAVPLLLEIAGAGRESPGAATGRLVAANTFGAIVGPMGAVFLLAPALGLWRSVAILGVATALAGAGLVTGRGRAAAGALAAILALGAIEAGRLPPARVRTDLGERLVSVREGSYGTTAVVEGPHDRWITVNNAYVLGGTAAAGEERWQAHLPLLLHPSPRKVAFLGFGTGITAGAALLHPIERVVALEIVPEVAAAARADFADANGGVAEDARAELVVDDGRHYLAATPHAFDVIVGDLLVPWRPGEAALYSREHFDAVRRALSPNGLFCQWLPVYQLSGEQLRIAVATFADVFPRSTLWRGNFLPDHPILALVGHLDPDPVAAARVDDAVRALAPALDLSHPFLQHPAGFWLFLVGPVDPAMAWLAGARRNTDAEPWLEILGPSAHASGVPATFARGPLLDILSGVLDRPLGGTPLAGLGREHLEWRSAGMSLARASQVPGEEGASHVLTLLRRLPRDLQDALGVEPALPVNPSGDPPPPR